MRKLILFCPGQLHLVVLNIAQSGAKAKIEVLQTGLGRCSRIRRMWNEMRDRFKKGEFVGYAIYQSLAQAGQLSLEMNYLEDEHE